MVAQHLFLIYFLTAQRVILNKQLLIIGQTILCSLLFYKDV